MTDVKDYQSIASDSTDTSILTVIENNQSQEVDSTPAFTSATALPEDFVCTDYDHTQINLYSPHRYSQWSPSSDSLKKNKGRERRIPTLL